MRDFNLIRISSVASITVTVGATMAVTLWPPGSSAATLYLHTLYSFCQSGGKCTDGQYPIGGLVEDAAGNLYGTTVYGGAHSQDPGGTVYELSPSNGSYTYQVLYSFCAKKHCGDGAGPIASLILDKKGNLWGTTSSPPTVFELLAPTPSRSYWKLKTLYTFGYSENGPDYGALTYSGAINGKRYDGKSPLYGMTAGLNSEGEVYQIARDPNTNHWTETVICDFNADCAWGYPYETSGGLIIDTNGNLFGMTSEGGYENQGNSAGNVIELTPGANNTWTGIDIYDFCINSPGCATGSEPKSTLLLGTDGDLYGTTSGLAEFNQPATAIQLVPSGGQFQINVLCTFGDANCYGGGSPVAGFTADPSGNLIGTTVNGGIGYRNHSPAGTIYEFQSGTYSLLYSFVCDDKAGTCPVGSAPIAGVILDKSGNIFGTTSNGGIGADNAGTVYELNSACCDRRYE